MQLNYDYTSGERDYYRLIWGRLRSRSLHVYIPSCLEEKSRRSALAKALLLVRAKVAQEANKKREAQDRERKLREDYPVISSLSDDNIVCFEPRASGLYIEGGGEGYYCDIIDIDVAIRLVDELKKMIEQIPRVAD